MRNLALAVFLSLIAPIPQLDAKIFNVPDDYSSIQAAIDECNSEYDLVLIAPGVYSGDGNRNLSIDGKHINIRGNGQSGDVIIDVGGSPTDPHRAMTIHGRGWAHVNITNLSFQNGFAENNGGCIAAEGVDMMISECTFTNNTSTKDGGCIALTDSGEGGSIICINSSFQLNDGRTGGAIYCHDLSVTKCLFSGNSSLRGGAIGGGGIIQILDCEFTLNNSTEEGGALYSFYYVQVEGSIFENNSSVYGGGISIKPGEYTRVSRCVFKDNEALEGGAISVWGSKYLDVVNSLFYGNSSDFYGGALLIHGSSYATLWNSTFTGNVVGGRGGAVLLDEGNLEIENSIFWNNNAGEGSEIVVTNEFFMQYPARLQIDNSVVMTSDCLSFGEEVDLIFNENIIQQSPVFVDPDTSNLQLNPDSPCIDNGKADGAPSHDLAYGTRPVGSGWDIGAYEYQTTVETGCHLLMSDTALTADDNFLLEALVVSNPEITTVNLVVALEYAGDFHFFPLWLNTFDYEVVICPYHRALKEILQFEWPGEVGSISGIAFWGALLDPANQNLIGDLGYIPWSCY